MGEAGHAQGAERGRVALSVRQDLRRAAALIGRLITPVAADPAVKGAFERSLDRISTAGMRLIVVAYTLSSLLVWPSDPLVFGDDPRALSIFARWRLSEILIFFGFYLVSLRWRAFEQRRQRYGAAFALYCLGSLLTGLTTSAMGGLDRGYFYALYALTGTLVVLIFDLRSRILLALLGNLAYLAGYFGLHPEHLDHPELGAVTMVLITINVGYVLTGHVLYHLIWMNWSQSQEVESKARSLGSAIALTQRILLVSTPIGGGGGDGRAPTATEAAVLTFEPVPAGGAEGGDGGDPSNLRALWGWLRAEARARGMGISTHPARPPVVVAPVASRGDGGVDALATLALHLCGRAEAAGIPQLGCHLALGHVDLDADGGDPRLDEGTEAWLRGGGAWHGGPSPRWIALGPSAWERLGAGFQVTVDGLGDGARRWLVAGPQEGRHVS